MTAADDRIMFQIGQVLREALESGRLILASVGTNVEVKIELGEQHTPGQRTRRLLIATMVWDYE